MRRFPRKVSDTRGFTLIEVIAVLMILGIIAAIAATRVTADSSDLIPQADILKSHLRFAQLKALSDDDSVSWGIEFPSSSTYRLVNTLAGGSTTASLKLPSEDSATHAFPAGVTCTASTVTFDTYGNLSTADVTITLTEGGSTKQFKVYAATGYLEDL